MILALLGALVVGLSLGLLGSGGSILTVPALIYLVGQEEKVAIAGSLAIVGLISLSGSIPYARRGEVAWPTVLAFGFPGMGGTYLGAYLSQFLSGTAQLVLFSIVMLLAAALMLRPSRLPADPAIHTPRAGWKVAVDGVLVGILTGLVGVGGGFLIVPALVLLGGLPMHRAVGTSLLIIALKSGSGFVKYLSVLEKQNLALDWQILGTFTVVGIVGTFGGSAIASRLPQNSLRKIFGSLLVVMAAYILWRSIGDAA